MFALEVGLRNVFATRTPLSCSTHSTFNVPQPSTPKLNFDFDINPSPYFNRFATIPSRKYVLLLLEAFAKVYYGIPAMHTTFDITASSLEEYQQSTAQALSNMLLKEYGWHGTVVNTSYCNALHESGADLNTEASSVRQALELSSSSTVVHSHYLARYMHRSAAVDFVADGCRRFLPVSSLDRKWTARSGSRAIFHLTLEDYK